MAHQLPIFICPACKRYIQYEYEDVRHLPFELRFEVKCPVCSNVYRIKGTHFQSLFGDRRKKETEESPPPEAKEQPRENQIAREQKAIEVYEFWCRNGEDLKKTASQFKMTQKTVRELLQDLPNVETGSGRSRA